MEGKIYRINTQRGMVAILTESDEYSIFEMLTDTNFDVGDEVYWTEDKPTGDCLIKNLTKNETSEVYFENHCVKAVNLKQQLRY